MKKDSFYTQCQAAGERLLDTVMEDKDFMNVLNIVKTSSVINYTFKECYDAVKENYPNIKPEFVAAVYMLHKGEVGKMPYKDLKKRKEYHREYYREYMRNHPEYREVSENNRKKNMEEWKKAGSYLYKFRRLTKKYGVLGVKVFLRDGGACVECGEIDFRVLVLDHILSKAKGGTDEYDNLQTLCCNCHTVKHFMENVEISTSTTQYSDDKNWMEFAKYLGQYSNCLSRQIGAVIVKDGKLLSIGWNGPPDGVGGCAKRNPNNENICPRKLINAKSGERLDMCLAVHAEGACVINAAKEGRSTYGATLYADCSIPCKNCLVSIINSGIVRVVCNEAGSKTNNFGIFYDRASEYIMNNSDLIIDFIKI